jgi:hypothetical protein
MGMIGFYSRFITNFSQIAEPLIALTKTYAKFKLTIDCQKAFDFFKESLSVVPFCHILVQTNPMFYTWMLAIHVLVQFSYKQMADDEEECLKLYRVRNEKPIFFLSHK